MNYADATGTPRKTPFPLGRNAEYLTTYSKMNAAKVHPPDPFPYHCASVVSVSAPPVSLATSAVVSAIGAGLWSSSGCEDAGGGSSEPGPFASSPLPPLFLLGLIGIDFVGACSTFSCVLLAEL